MSDITIDYLLDMLGERYIMVEHRLINTGMPESNGKHKELQQAKSALYDLILKEVVGEDSKVYRPDDLHKLSPEMQKAITMTITSDNRLRATQRKKLKELFDDNLQ